MKRYLAVLVVLFAVPLAAQQPKPPAPPAKPSPPAAPSAPAAPSTPVVQMPFIEEATGQPVNVRLDVSIRDNNDAAVSAPKTLMVILADRAMGRTRGAFEDRQVLIDSRPTVIDSRIRLNLTIESRGHAGPGINKPDQTLFWTNSFSLLLENGKPMLVFETSDPVTKRKLNIEVKATLLK